MICSKTKRKAGFHKARFVRKRTLVSASTTLTAQRSPSCHATLSLGADLHKHTKATASVAIGTAYTSNQQKMNIHFWKRLNGSLLLHLTAFTGQGQCHRCYFQCTASFESREAG